MPIMKGDLISLREFVALSRDSGGILRIDSIGRIAEFKIEPAIIRVKFRRLEDLGLLARKQDSVQVKNPSYIKSQKIGDILSTNSEPEFLTQSGPPYWELTEEGVEALDGNETTIEIINHEENQRIYEFIPASDRIVSLDHNSAQHQEAVSALEQVENELVKSNSLNLKPQEREAFVAEVRSAKQLISGKQVRQAAIYLLVQATGILSELWTRFKVETIGALAMAAVTALKLLVGL